MGESADTKVCPRCAETIKAAAEVCPHCQSRLARFAWWDRNLAGAAVAVVLLGQAIVVGVWLIPEDARSEGRRYARHRGDLAVVRVALDRAKVRPEFWVSGFVTNTGAFPWRVQELEARFQDVRGNVFDVYHPAVEDPFVVAPGQEHAFRVRLGIVAWTNAATVPQVRVQTATDGHLPPKD
jgi:membrane protein YdbS with pleckstrin-like domain